MAGRATVPMSSAAEVIPASQLVAAPRSELKDCRFDANTVPPRTWNVALAPAAKAPA